MGKSSQDMIERIEMLDYAKKVGIDTNCDSAELARRINEYKLARIKFIKNIIRTEYDL